MPDETPAAADSTAAPPTGADPAAGPTEPVTEPAGPQTGASLKPEDDGLNLEWPDFLPKPRTGGRLWTVLVTVEKFAEDQLTDLAASLTYYAVLAIFPALIAMMSVLSLSGQSDEVLTGMTESLARVVPESAMSTVSLVLNTIATAPSPGIGLVVGLAAAIWSASNYVKAFGRALNRIYAVKETRNGLLLTLKMYLLTAVLIVLVAAALVLVAVSGPVVDWVGTILHLEASVTATWNAIKLPLLLLVIVLIVALLYHFTPNLPGQPLRLVSVGAFVAIGIAWLASAGFGFYLTFMGDNSYTRTYGPFAGIVVFLFWLWIVNLALLFGGELDAVAAHVKHLRERLRWHPADADGELDQAAPSARP